MHGTTVTTDGLAEIDDALLRLRRLWSASRHRIVDDHGAAVDISSLIVVEACGRGAEAGYEVSIGDVAALADVAPSTATRLVDRAAAAGWVRRRPSSASARRTALVLTDDGAALRERAVRARQTWLADHLAGWDAADTARLGALLGRFADGLDPA